MQHLEAMRTKHHAVPGDGPLICIISTSDFEHSAYDKLLSLLSESELNRTEEFRVSQDRANFVFARGFLRHILGVLCGVSPHSVPLEIEQEGRPRIRPGTLAADVRFSIAHSGDMVTLIVAHGRDVGIDIELPRPLPELAPLARFVLTEQELRWAGSPVDISRFYRAWTMKEALLKAHGRGLLVDPRDVELGAIISSDSACDCPAFGKQWSVRWLKTGFCDVALAIQGHAPLTFGLWHSSTRPEEALKAGLVELEGGLLSLFDDASVLPWKVISGGPFQGGDQASTTKSSRVNPTIIHCRADGF